MYDQNMLINMSLHGLQVVCGRWVSAQVLWPSLAIATYLFLAPNFDFARSLTWHDGQRVAQLVLVSAVFTLGLAVPGARCVVVGVWAAVPRWSRVTLLAALATGAASVLRASLARWALLEWAMLLFVLFATICVAAGRRAGGAMEDRLFVVVMTAAATAYATKTIVVYAAMLTTGAGLGLAFNVRDLYTGFSNVRFFGHLQTMVLPFLLLPAMAWAKTSRQRVLLAIVPVVWWMLVAASGTRGTWVALASGMVAVLMFGGLTGRRWVRWQMAGLACGLACYAVFILWVPSLLAQPASFLHRAADIASLSAREVIWGAAVHFIAENPLLGIGPMHFAYYANSVAAHPHNAILQLASEWGIPAALLFTVVFTAGGLAFAGYVKRVTAHADDHAALIAVALLAALTGAAAQSMVDGVLVMPVSQVALVLICGWAMGIYFSDNAQPAQCGTWEKALCAGLILIAAGGILYGVMPEIGHLEQREAAYLAAHPGVQLLPRFWAQGWINP